MNREKMVFASIEGVIVRETEWAICVKTLGEHVWFPKSQLGHITYVEGGDMHEVRVWEEIEAIEIPEWLAREKGLDWDE